MECAHVVQSILYIATVYLELWNDSSINGRKGGAMGLQAHPILRVLHGILILCHLVSQLLRLI